MSRERSLELAVGAALAHGGNGWDVQGRASLDRACSTLDVESAEAQGKLELRVGAAIDLGLSQHRQAVEHELQVIGGSSNFLCALALDAEFDDSATQSMELTSLPNLVNSILLHSLSRRAIKNDPA